jgi:hypothetical protein
MNAATATVHPFSVFGPGPYRLVGYETEDDRALIQKYRENAGLTFTTNLCGGSCELCGTAIWNVYIFEAANGRRFRVGCDCAEKAGENPKAERRALVRRDEERRASITRMEREEYEREANLANPEIGEALTNAEVTYWVCAIRDLERMIERVSSRHVGTVGERLKSIKVRFEEVFAFESFYGVKRCYKFRTPEGHALTWWTTSGIGGLEEGETIMITATVKKHGDYTPKGGDMNGVTQLETEIARVKVMT